MSTDVAPDTAPVTAPQTDGIARDPDGRRRVVLPRGDLKKVRAVAKILESRGFVLGARCQGPPAGCGLDLVPEGHGTPDPGLGCACTRIHFGR